LLEDIQKANLKKIAPLIGIVLFALALWVLRQTLGEYHYHDLVREFREIPASRIILAMALTVLGYTVMTGYDLLAIRYIQQPLSYGRVALASFISYAFSSNIGISVLSAGAVRYRLYSSWGLSAEKVTSLMTFCLVTFWLGFFALSGAVLLIVPFQVPPVLNLPFASTRPLGLLFIILAGGYLVWNVLRKEPIRWRDWEFPVPSFSLSLGQVLVSSLDWALAAGVLYVLLPLSSSITFSHFLGIFLVAQFAGLVSNVPGGFGVLETLIVLLLTPVLPASSVLASLLAYRVIYYLFPLGAATVLLGTHELMQRKEQAAQAARTLGSWVPALVPHVFAVTTFISGMILIVSGAIPAETSRLVWLRDFFPLPVMEVSHFVGSLAGAGLILLARGIQRRLDAAYHLTLLLLATGVFVSLLKGFDYEEAILLSAMFGAFLPCRRYFYRKASLLSQRFTTEWVLAILLVLIGAFWIGIFSYKHVAYADEIWWRFALHGDAPRFLRASVGIVGTMVFFSMAKLLRTAPPEPALPGPVELARARTIVAAFADTTAALALLGDKALLFSESGRSFIMYGIEGRSWVAMGDPVGPVAERSQLIWQFREICDRHDGWTVFYEVAEENLPRYIELGLTLFKIGEEARVPLGTFSLEGSRRKGLRYLAHKVERAGCTFEIVPAREISPLLPELKKISNTWLADKKTREKGFSLGFFQEAYLQLFPAAVVRREGRIIAFANIWAGGEKTELSIDLMRHLPDAPQGVMEYLFVRLMLWGKDEGYQWFSLGMAPLSGLDNQPFAPLWNRLGALLFQHGEHFYNFQGLRGYKEKFDPQWKPRYLASPAGLALPRILTNIAGLISRGIKGVIAK
jgi:phosphatidylglycerol lysyltransferase